MAEQEPLIAIVGMAGRFPGAKTVGELWRNLRDGVEALTFWSDEELLANGVDPARLSDPNYVKACFYLPDQGNFDAGFFEVNPREAELTDPQQRIFLEVAWETLEDAGIDPGRFDGSIGVFASAARTHYMTEHLLPNPAVLERMGIVNVYLANEKDFLATRVSYKLDLKGPSVTVATACSSSLVGLHLGSQALLSGECDVVLAGGICLAALSPAGYHYVDGGVFAPDGHVRAFDKRAGGQVGGNGVAMVALKRLEDALADGDTIRAVVRGSALDNDGVQKVSFSAPGVDGQARVIAEALEVADVEPDTIGYVEAHGTGTSLGDPIEIRALTRAWRQWTDRTGFCPIGSLKTNVGHLDAGAGAAGVIKAALALQHGLIPPSLNYDEPNPEIDFERSPFFVNTELRPWPRGATPRRAAVSSFGMGGTNAHVILEEAPELEPTSPSRGLELLCVSARSDRPLEAATGNLAKHLEGHREHALADVAYTTQLGRKAFRRRRVVLATDRVDAANALRKLDQRQSFTGTASDKPLRVAYLFTGQGAQHPNMLRGLYESERIFKNELDRCCDQLAGHMGRDLREQLFPAAGAEAAAAEQLARTENTQPALFAVEWALAQLWTHWGVTPAAMLGHSIGEYVAACVAGVFSLEDALSLVAARGRAIGALPAGGAMLAVHLDEGQLTARLGAGDGVEIAAINAAELCVVSGPQDAVAALEAELSAGGVSTRRLRTSHAFHSALMDPCLDEFREAVRAVQLSAPRQKLVSCTSGTWLTAEQATDPEYWVRHLRQPVRFADGLATLDTGDRALLEVGPGETLASLAKLGGVRGPVVASARHPKDERDDREVLLMALGRLWVHGVDVDWGALHGDEVRRKVPLPTYPWEHQRYWIDPPKADGRAQRKTQREADPADWFYTPSWRRCPLAVGAGASPTSAKRLAGRWWLFPDRPTDGSEGRAAELREALEQSGAEVTVVEARTVAALRAELDRGGVPDRIVDLRGLDPQGERTPQRLEQAQVVGFESLMALGQALAERDLDREVRIDVLTTGMQDVTGGELRDPEKATVLGVCKAICAELTGVRCRSVDLEETTPTDTLVSELVGSGHERTVAWRGPHRWAFEYAPVRLEDRAAGAGRLAGDGCYLVTGGLGGIGLALAELLAREARAKLVLTGRAGLPDRSAWDAWLAEHGADDSTSRRIRAVRSLEELGSEVLVCAADAADEAAMAAAVAAARERFGTVRGVIHSAGLPGAGLLSLKTREEAAAVLAPKVRGTQVLERLLADEPLDFFVLCSSLATAVTAVGQVDYFAANAYLDAWAHAERARRPERATVSINWDAWNQAGMAVDTAVPEAMRAGREEALKLGLTNEEGRDALLRILSGDLAQVLVSTRDLSTRILEHEEELAIADETSGPESDGTGVQASGSGSEGYARPALSVDFRAPTTPTEEQVVAVWGDLLGIAGVGIDDPFFELGGNSLLMMQLSVRLKSLFGVSMPIKALFDTPTVRSLAERIDSIRALSDGPPETNGPDGSDGSETEEFAL